MDIESNRFTYVHYLFTLIIQFYIKQWFIYCCYFQCLNDIGLIHTYLDIHMQVIKYRQLFHFKKILVVYPCSNFDNFYILIKYIKYEQIQVMILISTTKIPIYIFQQILISIIEISRIYKNRYNLFGTYLNVPNSIIK